MDPSQEKLKISDDMSAWRAKIETRLFEQIDLAPLVFFRVLFGGIMFWEVTRYYDHGWVERYYTDPSSGESWVVDQTDYLTSRQRRKLPDRPDMILLFCHYLKQELREEGHGDVQIRAVSRVSLNGRAPQLLVDSTRDLTQVERSLMPATWIIPLKD